jgi:hypothetical protein
MQRPPASGRQKKEDKFMAKKLKKSKKLEATKPLTVIARGPARG